MDHPPIAPDPPRPLTAGQIRLRLLAGLVALGAGLAAVVVAIELVRAALPG